jgi:hypothetical protein
MGLAYTEENFSAKQAIEVLLLSPCDRHLPHQYRQRYHDRLSVMAISPMVEYVPFSSISH